MQDSTSWRGWGRGQKSSVGWVCTAEAYCRNVNPPNVLQLEEEQDHRLNWAFRAGAGGGGGGKGRGGGEQDEKIEKDKDEKVR